MAVVRKVEQLHTVYEIPPTLIASFRSEIVVHECGSDQLFVLGICD